MNKDIAKYAEYVKPKPIVLDKNEDEDVKKIVSIIQKLTGIVLYVNDMTDLSDIINNPEKYFESRKDIESISDLKFLISYNGGRYEI